MYTGVAELLQKRYNELVRQMESRAAAESKESLANSETVSLQSGKELPKSEEASPNT
jgi:hypothetical protein